MLKRNLRWVMGKTEPMEKFGKLNQWKICVPSFLSAERSPCKNVFKRSHALMLKWNLGRVTGKIEPTEKFGKLNRWKFMSPVFRVLMEIQCWPL